MSRLLELEMMGDKPLVTGRMYFRDAAGGPKIPGKKVMLVFGVIAVPENFPIKGEHVSMIRGFANPDSAELHFDPVGQNYPQYYGWSVEQILYEPIWKV